MQSQAAHGESAGQGLPGLVNLHHRVTESQSLRRSKINSNITGNINCNINLNRSGQECPPYTLPALYLDADLVG